MATMLETPSRIWRRIEAIEQRDMPSLPSLPAFEDSGEVDDDPQESGEDDDELLGNIEDVLLPIHSTPTTTHHTLTSTLQVTESNSSTARFAHSVASRSNKSSGGLTRHGQNGSLDLPSLPAIYPTPAMGSDSEDEGIESKSSVPDVYLPPEDGEHHISGPDFSLADALESVSREGSPPVLSEILREDTLKKKGYDYSLSLKSESKLSPLEKYRHVALRKTNPRARTPSLSRTSSSETSSTSQSTPVSNRSRAPSQSHSASSKSSSGITDRSDSNLNATNLQDEDEATVEQNSSCGTHETRSMDITDVHISPPRVDGGFEEDTQTEERGGQTISQNPQDEPEPTFTFDSDPTPYIANSKAATFNTSHVRSSSPSIAFTPTPALPRPRARFNLPPPPTELLSTPLPGSGEDAAQSHHPKVVPATPYSRPSFLLSVINSTARPRVTAGTPYPREFGTPSFAESTPIAGSSSNNSVSGTNLRTAFAGIGPRPRIALAPRPSHPLSQVTHGGASSDSEVASPMDDGPALWGTPSPYDGATDKASFISTASSHDLITHARANTSFDPAMGFGPGAPVGRFNANKLNTYLHGLNRRLQEENEVLVERLKELEEERRSWGNLQAGDDSKRRLSNEGRRRTSLGTVLGDVQEDVAESWLEEKAELERMLESLKVDVKKSVTQKGEVEKMLQNEREGREVDKQRWKDRMIEAQEGVSELVTSLEKKLITAEGELRKFEKDSGRQVKELEKALAGVEGERDVAIERATKAERLLESGKELGGALAEANERVAQIMGDLRNANMQITSLEDEVMGSDARIDELEKEVREHKEIITSLEADLDASEHTHSTDRAKITKLEETLQRLDEQLNEAKCYAELMEQGASDAGEQIHKLEKELGSAQETINRLTISERQNVGEVEAFEKEVQAGRERVRQLEEAVEAAEEKMMKDDDDIQDLKNQVASLKREHQKDSSTTSRDISRNSTGVVYTATEYEALEQELDEANKEKAKLRTLLEQSPARKAIEKAKDLKIELLEREKEDLLERNKMLRTTINGISTPNKVVDTGGISPIHRHVLSMSIRMPKTPGPLRDMSWLNSTQPDSSLTPLVSEIQRLQGELDRANESIDDKLDKLENAGLDVVSLAQRLEDAKSKISALEDELACGKRKEERRARRLARMRCRKCHIKLDPDAIYQSDESSSVNISNDNLATEPPTPPTRSSEALKANLRVVNDQLEELKAQWEAEKTRLLGEKAVLEDAAGRLNFQIKNTKADMKKASEGARAIATAKTNVQDELIKAKETIAVLEKELSSERSHLRSMVGEQERMQREKKQILTDMQRTEFDMDEVRQQMLKLKKENQRIEKELRENANIDQKARLLETRVAENTDTIDQLRQERSMIVAEHKELQRRFTDATEVANELRNKCSSLSTAHDNRRHELDMHMLEIDDLRKALDDRANDLQRVEQEKEKVSSEKDFVARTVASLETDLKRVKRDAEEFGKDLKALKMEKEELEAKSKKEFAKAERAKKQAQSQIRVLNEQLSAEKAKLSEAEEQFKARCSVADPEQVSKLKLQHNKECKGLIVQIHYLKAKFLRESLFREDLIYQKHYLLVLLQQFEKSEQNIFACIAQIGFPLAPAPPRRNKPTLKSVVIMTIFLSRVKKSSDAWRQERAAKQLVVVALGDVRKRRLISAE